MESLIDKKNLFLRGAIILVFLLIGGRLFYLQVINSSYKEKAVNNVLKREEIQPSRGLIFDRNGLLLVENRASNDIICIKPNSSFDTLLLSKITGLTALQIRNKLIDGIIKRERKVVIERSITLDKINEFVSNAHLLPTFELRSTLERSYPNNVSGSLIGYIGEKKKTQQGFLEGIAGVEAAYEDVLRGQKGVFYNLVDVRGNVIGSFEDGAKDTASIQGNNLTLSIDYELQILCEELLRGKIGNVTAIDPSTGEILAIASSPSYNSASFVGKDRGNNYMEYLRDKRRPLYSRALKANYPPGSTFKIATALVALDRGIINENTTYYCDGRYTLGKNKFVKCHRHFPNVDLKQAIAYSCNSYFCHQHLRVLTDKNITNKGEAVTTWRNEILDLGLGKKLGSDLIEEATGYVPSSALYDKIYNKRWNPYVTVSLAIGQGELQIPPIQMVNLAAIIANRGFYYTPHIGKSISGDTTGILDRFKTPIYTHFKPEHFEMVIKGMFSCVNVGGGTGTVASIAGLDVCGKTGTVQNRYADHSAFICFAPMQAPKIAVSVYIENAGFGSTTAAPIASLVVEKYLNGKIARKELEARIKNLVIKYPQYEDTTAKKTRFLGY